jgi:alpha-galactosidase
MTTTTIANCSIEIEQDNPGLTVTLTPRAGEAAYADGFVPLPEIGSRTVLLVNGTLEDRVIIELPDSLGTRNLKVWNCTGELVLDESRELSAGVHSIAVPPAGTCTLEN